MNAKSNSWETTVGRVLAEIKIENLEDLMRARNGQIASNAIRALNVQDALVDTGASELSMSKLLIQQLGLKQWGTRTARTAVGVRTFNMVEPVRLTILGRDCTLDVSEVADDVPVLIGQLPLEHLDLIVDPRRGRLIPAHEGQFLMDML